ncbi:Crp/Fnr family transcriptional regulator [Paenimyroides tangerinum]|uniref:Crp/Fnr family transcriptional regulator n=1 Tax=Paenimyroides tangerinum TaxID=2488728 RepID=A0A3P3W9E5_9FLAO|nr:Crp/Fnr family transcriptional regulator [Paenimyroides tangerinum]RRJ91620.1 Crp/Fnr family transcriptional regulator [Paenimyroides tangerinum]
MDNLLLQNIAKHIELTQEEQQIVLSKFETASYKTKTILLEQGENGSCTYFVNKGIIRNYTVDDNGAEHIISFASPGWWIADMYSFLAGKPSHSFIEVIDDAEVMIITRENQDLLYESVPKLERYFRILIENSLIANQQRLIDKLSLTAEERYENFQKKYPDVKNCLPQKHIASYIGVTPEFFSKMKSKLLKKK